MAKKSDMWLWIVIIVVILLIGAGIFVYLTYYRSSSTPDDFVVPNNNITNSTEILDGNFFTDGRTSLDVNVRGVTLGMDRDSVVQRIGEPTGLINVNDTPDYAENWAYSGDALGLHATNANSSKTAMVVHLEHGRVRSINFYELGWPLISQTDIFALYAEDFMKLMGKPQVDTDLPNLELRRFIYTDKGVEIYFLRGKYPKTITLTYPL